MHRLVEEWRELWSQLRLRGRNLRRIEQGVGIAGRTAQRILECGRQIDPGDLGADRVRQALGEDGTKDRRTRRAADVTPELELAGADTEVPHRKGALDGVDVER